MSDNERVEVEFSEIKVGDLIYVEERVGPDKKMYEGVVTVARPGSVETNQFVFAVVFNHVRTFYRLPSPPPDEPKGLGAVVEDSEGDLWTKTLKGWVLATDEPVQWDQVLNYSPLTVKSDGYTPGT